MDSKTQGRGWKVCSKTERYSKSWKPFVLQKTWADGWKDHQLQSGRRYLLTTSPTKDCYLGYRENAQTSQVKRERTWAEKGQKIWKEIPLQAVRWHRACYPWGSAERATERCWAHCWGGHSHSSGDTEHWGHGGGKASYLWAVCEAWPALKGRGKWFSQRPHSGNLSWL